MSADERLLDRYVETFVDDCRRLVERYYRVADAALEQRDYGQATGALNMAGNVVATVYGALLNQDERRSRHVGRANVDDLPEGDAESDDLGLG